MLLTLSLGLLSGPLVAADSRTLLVLGDSLSAEYGLERGRGWVALLERRLREEGPRTDIVNASISGETTAGGKARLEELLRRHRPHTVLIELGANDGLRGLSLAALESNLDAMVRSVREAGARAVLVGMKMPPNLGRSYSEQFEAVFRRVAQRHDVPLVPFLLERVADDDGLFQSDRIHPAEKAQPIMLDNVWPVLRPVLKTG